MTGADFTSDDMAVLRKEGFRAEMFRALIAEGVARKAPPPAPPPRPTGHRPGAWPPGTSPPAAVVHAPDADWPAALSEYCAWLAAGRPTIRPRCECAAHQRPDGGTR